MAKNFIITKEHRRFTEFAHAVRNEPTIGICHGDAGIGKTQSARRYAHWDTVEPFITEWGPRTEEDAKFYATDNRCRNVFYTPRCAPEPKNSCARSHTCRQGSVSALTNTSAASTR